MDKNVLRAIDGVAVYPLISLGIFFLFFAGLLVYVLVAKPELIDAMKHMPLGADDAVPGPQPKGGSIC